jgi:hypothetical protein
VYNLEQYRILRVYPPRNFTLAYGRWEGKYARVRSTRYVTNEKLRQVLLSMIGRLLSHATQEPAHLAARDKQHNQSVILNGTAKEREHACVNHVLINIGHNSMRK